MSGEDSSPLFLLPVFFNRVLDDIKKLTKNFSLLFFRIKRRKVLEKCFFIVIIGIRYLLTLWKWNKRQKRLFCPMKSLLLFLLPPSPSLSSSIYFFLFIKRKLFENYREFNEAEKTINSDVTVARVEKLFLPFSECWNNNRKLDAEHRAVLLFYSTTKIKLPKFFLFHWSTWDVSVVWLFYGYFSLRKNEGVR